MPGEESAKLAPITAPKPDVSGRVNRLIVGNRWFFEAISGQTGVEIGVDPGADCYFTFQPRPAIMFGEKSVMANPDLPDEHAIFIGAHEEGHVIQFLEEPQTYKSTFALEEERATADPASKNLWNDYFSVLVDIHANGQVIHRSVRFQQAENWGQVPAQLYQRLFPDDMRSVPLASQLVDGLLVRVMQPDRQVVLDPEVSQMIDQPVEFLGDHYDNLVDLVRKGVYRPGVSLNEGLFTFEQIVQPLFRRLLEKDKASGKAQNYQKSQQAKLIDGDFDPRDPKAFEKAAEYINEKNKSVSDKAKEADKAAFAKHMEGKHTESEIREMWERMQRTEGVAQNMKDMWWRMVQRSVELAVAYQGGFTTGSRLDLSAVQRQMPVLLTDPGQARIYARSVLEPQKEMIRPKRIRLFVLPDCSGSMFSQRQRIERTQDATYAMVKSLVLFADEGILNNPEFPVEVSAAIIPYGTDADPDYMDIDITADPVRAGDVLVDKIIGLNEDKGNTNDNNALVGAQKKLEGRPAVLDPDEELIILMQITDGGTGTLNESIETLKRLKARGVVCRAIQIQENLSPDEKDKFEKEWGSDGKGIENVDVLPTVCEQLFAQILIK